MKQGESEREKSMAMAFKTNWNLIKLPNSDTSVGFRYMNYYYFMDSVT